MKKYIIVAFIFLTILSVPRAQAAIPPDLSVGSTGSSVENLQTLLINRKFHIPAIESSFVQKGYFGSQTKNALAAYQRSVNLPAFGFFGPLTRAQLKAEGVSFSSTGAIVVSFFNTNTSSSQSSQTYYSGSSTLIPSTPTNLSSSGVTQTRALISWTASAGPVAGYRIYRNGVFVTNTANSTDTTYLDSGLNPGSVYVYTVSAYNANGNASDQSGGVYITTQSSLNPTPIWSGITQPVATTTTATVTSTTTVTTATTTTTTGTTTIATITATTTATTSVSYSGCTNSGPEAPIFVIMGQSNAAGLGKISQAETATAGLDSVAWPFSYWTGSQTSWKLGSTIKDAQHGFFGPDYGIAYELSLNGKRGYYVYKYAVGGTNLAVQWGSRGSGGLYDKAVSSLKKAESAICAEGKKPVVKAVFWMQGESDAVNLNMTVLYESNLRRLIKQSREDFLGPTAPFIIGLIDSATGMWKYAPFVRDAEKKVGSEAHNGYVETNDISVYPGTSCGTGECMAHYNAKGQLELGKRFYEKYVSLNGGRN